MKIKNVMMTLLMLGLLFNVKIMAQKKVQVEQSMYIDVPKDS